MSSSSTARSSASCSARSTRCRPMRVRCARRASACTRAGSANMDEGWTRWLLEQYEFTFKNLSNDDIRGDLSQFDVILFADETEDEILNGHAPGTMPDRYVGGIGVDGAANLREFVERGGWVVAWDQRGGLRDHGARAAAAEHGEGRRARRSSSFPGSLDRTGSGAGASARGRCRDEAGQRRDRDVRRLAGVHDRAAGRGRQAARGAATSMRTCAIRAPRIRCSSAAGSSARHASSPAASPPRACRWARAARSSSASARTGAASRTTRSNCCSIRCSNRRLQSEFNSR